jgi:hypothetical protein
MHEAGYFSPSRERFGEVVSVSVLSTGGKACFVAVEECSNSCSRAVSLWSLQVTLDQQHSQLSTLFHWNYFERLVAFRFPM